MSVFAAIANTRLQQVRPTKRFVHGLARMKGLGEAYADELSLLDALWTKASATRAPEILSAAREYEANLIRHITHTKAIT